MKTTNIMLVSLLFAVFSGCNGQTKKENSQLAETKKVTPLQENSLAKPQIDVKVNKQYDHKGNIVKFDSTYSYFYSSPKGSMNLDNDSVFSSFRSFFEKSYPNLMDRRINNIFFNDSLFKYDFFNNDYFQKRFELNNKMFENMYKQMDSIKRCFMKQNYPDGYQKKKII
ncbi:MAG: hypothetical protein ACXVPU_17175 [Bacteroidia bacterium]